MEFVADRTTKEAFPRSTRFAERFAQLALDEGLTVWPNVGHADGTNGDLAMLAPPFTSLSRRYTRSSCGLRGRWAFGPIQPLGGRITLEKILAEH